jgi:antitoxin HicB
MRTGGRPRQGRSTRHLWIAGSIVPLCWSLLVVQSMARDCGRHLPFLRGRLEKDRHRWLLPGEHLMSQAPERDERTVERFISLPYHLSVVRDGEEKGMPWTASVEEFPGCTSRGKTPDEALSGVQEAMASWIMVALKEGRDVPEPRSTSSHSGRLLLRMPRTLHAELTRAAERESVSLNQFITDTLASSVAWRGRSPSSSGEGPIQTPGAESLTTEPSAARPVRREPSRLVTLALAANFVAVAVAGIVAIALLVAAWR